MANRIGLNFPLQGIEPIAAQAAAVLSTGLTAVTGTTVNNVTVAIVGDMDGAISKVRTHTWGRQGLVTRTTKDLSPIFDRWLVFKSFA